MEDKKDKLTLNTTFEPVGWEFPEEGLAISKLADDRFILKKDGDVVAMRRNFESIIDYTISEWISDVERLPSALVESLPEPVKFDEAEEVAEEVVEDGSGQDDENLDLFNWED